MKLVYAAAVALVLAASPCAVLAQDARIAPVVSTKMQRTCQAQTTFAVTLNAGRTVDAEPVVVTTTRGLSASTVPDGLRIRQTVNGPDGDLLLDFTVTPARDVIDARLSGSAFDAMGAGPSDLSTIAATMAEDVPERLLVGRTFAVGDGYYPDELRSTLIGRIIGELGLPFPVDGSLDIVYRGELEHAGRRAWLFEGTMAVSGAGALQGTEASMDQTSRVRMIHDAETGLVLSARIDGETRIGLDGKPFSAQKHSDAYDCRIVAR